MKIIFSGLAAAVAVSFIPLQHPALAASAASGNSLVRIASSTATTPAQQEIEFDAPDGFRLSGTFWPSIGNTPAPVMILVHQFNSNRHDFDKFVPLLLDQGYAVFTYDIRGFGQSRNGNARIDDFQVDVAGAIAWLKNRQDINPAKIGVLGASVGANVAFVVAGWLPEIKAAVSLSPSDTGPGGPLMGRGIAGFSPHNLFVASDEREKRSAAVIFSLSQSPKIQKVYPGFGHGRSLLNSQQAQTDILAFLRQAFAR